ncbi:hypothetical protein EMMF5_006054 [Cystobasidiomycetes sp. EMM_F5]
MGKEEASINGHAAYEEVVVGNHKLDKEAEANLALVHGSDKAPPTAAEARKVLWKIDLIILPILFLVNYAGLAACRFLLGCAEAVMVVAFTAITGMWYTRDEQGTRVGIWFGATAAAELIGGASCYGLLVHQATYAISIWRMVFLIWGITTMMVGVLFLIFMPSTIQSCWWLSNREKYVALERIRSNLTGTVSTKFEISQVREALLDPRLYFVFLVIFGSGIPNGAVTSFGTIIIKGFGYTTKQTTLLGMSTGGSAMMIGLPTTAQNARYAGYVVMFFWPITAIFILSWLAAMMAGHTKRICFLIGYQLAYAAGNITGGQIFQPRDAPDYLPAKFGMIVGLVAECIFLTAIYVTHRIWNKRRDANLKQSGLTIEDEPDDAAFMNWTDFEQKRFRWPY